VASQALLEFIRQLTEGEALLRMKGGTPALVNRLIDGIDIHSGSPVEKVEEQGDKILVENGQKPIVRSSCYCNTNTSH
jgi:hypothetical protein